MDKINVLISGATGYIGTQLTKILYKHKKVNIKYLCGSSSIGKKISYYDKDLKKANFVEISILQNWTDIVGEKIAKYSWPEKIIFSKSNNDLNGKVFLKVKRGWAMEVEYKNQEIIEKLNAKNMSDMGKVMAEIKKHKSSSQIDMANASSYVKIVLNS